MTHPRSSAEAIRCVHEASAEQRLAAAVIADAISTAIGRGAYSTPSRQQAAKAWLDDGRLCWFEMLASSVEEAEEIRERARQAVGAR